MTGKNSPARIILCLMMALAVQSVCRAQNPPDTAAKAGVYGAYLLNRHTADFRALPGVPNCCPLFESGSGSGFAAGLLYDIPLSAGLGLQFRLGYAAHDATLSRTENTLVSVNNAAVPGAFEHTIQATLATLGLEPTLRLNLWKGLYLLGGVRLGYVITASYAQSEQIVQPTDRGVFLVENSRTRNVNSGDVPQAEKLHIALNAGLGYALPLNARGSLWLVPEATYSYALSPVVTGYAWHASSIRLGASLQWAFLPGEKPDTPAVTVPPPNPQPPQPRPDTILAQVDVSEVLADGTERPVKELVVEQFRSRHLRPLLNYIFFDENNGVLPNRYTRLDDPGTFQMDSLVNQGTMETYHHLLNIVGWRLRKRPDAHLTLTGCNANVRGELGNRALSKTRAEAVAAYLTDVWKIDPSRIDVVARDLPLIPSGARTEDGVAENMRVELASDVEEIMDPVITDDTLMIPAAARLRFRPRVKATAGLDKWQLGLSTAGRDLHTSSGTTQPQAVDLDLSSLTPEQLRSGIGIRAAFDAQDTRGQRSAAGIDLPLRLVTIEQKLRTRREDVSRDKYSMILFDYAQSGLSRPNKKIMDEVKKRLAARSKVEVVGHTDRIGGDESNLRLSTRRAEEAGAYIAAPGIRTYGVGRRNLLYDNNIPEGRFYCRTVEINVETVISR